MTLFHAFTGSDSTSVFKFKGRRSCFKTKDQVPSLMEEIVIVNSTPLLTSPQLKEVVMQFVCMLYSNVSLTDDIRVYLVRMRVFCHKTRDVERLPPTSDALDQHLNRSVFQASIWTTLHEPLAPVHDPRNYGWVRMDSKLVPIWMTLPLPSSTSM